MTDSPASATVAIIATLDTKAAETDYLRSQLVAMGVGALVIDAGTFAAPGCAADIGRDAVADAAGVDPNALASLGKAAASEAIARGVTAILRRLYEDERLTAVIALGGGAGAWIGGQAMQTLPIGIPKIIVSPVPMRDIKPVIGTRDILVFHSVVDLVGLNSVLRDILRRAAVAATSMVNAQAHAENGGRAIGLTVKGITQKAGENFRRALEAGGYEVMAFHASGMGGRAMDELVDEGRIDGVIDLTTQELTGELYGGTTHSDHQRFLVPSRKGVPQVVCPGAIETLSLGRQDPIPAVFADRPRYTQGPTFRHVRIGLPELKRVAETLCERLNRSVGKVAVLIPRRGFSVENQPGGAIYFPEENRIFEETVRAQADSGIAVHGMDLHIDDPAFAAEGVRILKAL